MDVFEDYINQTRDLQSHVVAIYTIITWSPRHNLDIRT